MGRRYLRTREGRSTKVANAAFAFAFVLVKPVLLAMASHHTYGGRLDNHLVDALLLCSKLISSFLNHVEVKYGEP